MSASPFRPAIVDPRSGILAPRDRCPVPVFARKRVGNGLSHDPTSSEPPVPVAGTATRLHSAGRALTIATADGGGVLPRIGIDRVAPRARASAAGGGRRTSPPPGSVPETMERGKRRRGEPRRPGGILESG